jgi:hypothetical protein
VKAHAAAGEPGRELDHVVVAPLHGIEVAGATAAPKLLREASAL